MKKLLFLCLLFVTACGSQKTLVCEKSTQLSQFGAVEVKVTTNVKFKDDLISEYKTQYRLELKDYSKDEIEKVYESVKEYYSLEENRVDGSIINFYQRKDAVIYEIIYDMNNYEKEIRDYFGDINNVRKNLEEKDNYKCQ